MMQMKKTCKKTCIVDEKTCIIKTSHLMMQMKKTCIKKTHHLMMQMKKTCIIKNIALDDVDEKNMYYKKHCT